MEEESFFFCKECGQKLPSNSKFCVKCGARGWGAYNYFKKK